MNIKDQNIIVFSDTLNQIKKDKILSKFAHADTLAWANFVKVAKNE